MLELLFGPPEVSMAILGALGSLAGKALGALGIDKVLGIGGAAAGAAADFEAQGRQHEFSAKQAAINRKFQKKQAQKQMDFQERMSSTQTQRAAKDMEKAGLNRILALGQPAAAPPGAMASGSQASGVSASPGSSMASGRQAGIAAATAKENIELMKKNQNLVDAKTYKTTQEGRKEAAWADKIETTAVPFTMFQDTLGREGGAAKEILQAIKDLQSRTGGSLLDIIKKSGDYTERKWHKFKNIPKLKENRR